MRVVNINFLCICASAGITFSLLRDHDGGQAEVGRENLTGGTLTFSISRADAAV